MPCNATMCDNADAMLLYKKITHCTKELQHLVLPYSDAPCAFEKPLMSMYMCLGFQKTVQKSPSCKYAPVLSIMFLPLCLR